MTEKSQPDSALDQERLSAMVRELGEDWDSLVARFLEQMAATVADLRGAIERDQRERALRLVHSLKSLCATFGAQRVTEAGRRLEAGLRDGAERQALGEPLEALGVAAAEAERELSRWLATSA